MRVFEFRQKSIFYSVAIALLSFPLMSWYAGVFIVASFLSLLFPAKKAMIIFVSSIISAVCLFRLFSLTAYPQQNGYFISIGAFAALLSLLLVVFNYFKSRPMLYTTILLFSALAGYLATEPHSFYRRFFYALTVLIASNYFIIIKELDQPNAPKKLSDVYLSICAPWNFPIFLNLTQNQILRHSAQNETEYLSSQKKGVLLLLKIVPFALVFKVIYLLIIHHGSFQFQISEFTEFNFKDKVYFEIRDNLPIAFTGLRDLLAIVIGGCCYLFGLIHIISSSVAVAKNFGFDIPYQGATLRGLFSFKSLVQDVYKYYSKTIIEVYYRRFRELLAKLLGHSSPEKRYMVYLCLIAGGLTTNLLIEISYSLYSKGIFKISSHLPKSIPYFVLFSFLILSSSKIKRMDKTSLSRSVWRIIRSVLMLCFIYSLRRLVVFNMTWLEYFDIFVRAFHDLAKILNFNN